MFHTCVILHVQIIYRLVSVWCGEFFICCMLFHAQDLRLCENLTLLDYEQRGALTWARLSGACSCLPNKPPFEKMQEHMTISSLITMMSSCTLGNTTMHYPRAYFQDNMMLLLTRSYHYTSSKYPLSNEAQWCIAQWYSNCCSQVSWLNQ